MTIILVHRSKAANTLSSPKSALKKLPLKDGCEEKCEADENPVVTSAEVVLEETDLVSIDDAAVAQVSRFILSSMRTAHYTPRTWRTHALHLLPPEPFDWANPLTRAVFDWIFLVSALNFSFWSEREGLKSRYAVEWRAGWGREERELWTGYWTLPAAIDRALEDGIPITDPAFYADETRCPDATIAHIFRRAPCSEEDVPLLRERIAVMREVGHILVSRYEGSFMHFIRAFHSSHPTGTALDFVRLITYTFPSFADECPSPFPPPSPASPPTTLYFWKRAQILTAETWAAFYPPPSSPSPSSSPTPHPIFPNGGVRELTMFADYRVPQVLHHLGLLSYTPTLSDSLRAHEPLDHGSEAEVAIRAGSIVAVERVARCMRDMMIGAVGASASADGEVREEEEEVQAEDGVNARDEQGSVDASDVCSVLIDFYLWDLAKGVEAGQADAVDSLRTRPILPAHRTRSIWY